jgi:hypothetical protein
MSRQPREKCSGKEANLVSKELGRGVDRADIDQRSRAEKYLVVGRSKTEERKTASVNEQLRRIRWKGDGEPIETESYLIGSSCRVIVEGLGRENTTSGFLQNERGEESFSSCFSSSDDDSCYEQ